MDSKKAKVYCFANQKGGVAKTTTAVNLGAYVAATGASVLVIDIDPQSNTTTSLGIDPRTVKLSIYDVLIEQEPIQNVLTLTNRIGLDLIPSSPELAGAELEMAQFMARERRLDQALKPIYSKYDYIFIDGPPSLGLLTINGLTAVTHGVVIPVQCEYLALEGLSLLLSTIQQVRAILNDKLKIAGVLLTMYDGRTRLSQDIAKEVQDFFPKEVYRTIIPRSVRLSEAPSHGQTILNYAPQSAGAQAYKALATEFIARAEQG